jgi:hypothetical protein
VGRLLATGVHAVEDLDKEPLKHAEELSRQRSDTRVRAGSFARESCRSAASHTKGCCHRKWSDPPYLGRARSITSSRSGGRTFEEDAIRSTAGNCCTSSEAKICRWGGRRSHPDDLRTCELTGLTIHAEFATAGAHPRLQVLADLLDGIEHRMERGELASIVAEQVDAARRAKRCRIEAARLSTPGRVCGGTNAAWLEPAPSWGHLRNRRKCACGPDRVRQAQGAGMGVSAISARLLRAGSSALWLLQLWFRLAPSGQSTFALPAWIMREGAAGRRFRAMWTQFFRAADAPQPLDAQSVANRAGGIRLALRRAREGDQHMREPADPPSGRPNAGYLNLPAPMTNILLGSLCGYLRDNRTWIDEPVDYSRSGVAQLHIRFKANALLCR